MPDLGELQVNLQTYKTQLEQVSSLLQLDMNNAEYQKLAGDLREAIKLTEELIKTEAKNSTSTGELQLRKGEVTLKAGDRCLAPYGDQSYPALIVSVDGDGDQVTIRYFGYPDVETKAMSQLKPLPPPSLDPASITPGYECQALWVGDGEWYDVVVEEATEGGYKVRFTTYKSEAEVPLEYMRSKDAIASANASATGVGKKRPAEKEKQEPKGFVIPDHLRILPTDTEEEKARKRKKVKYLKSAVKKKDNEDEEEGGSKTWQSYLNKSKKPKGLKVLRKESIFASPDSVDGRVGVTGSGQGMTGFEDRKKYIKGQLK